MGQQIRMIPVAEVLFFTSDEKYTRVQTETYEALIRKPIKELVEELDPEHFWQIHRATIVNVKAIAGITRDLRGRQLVQLKNYPQKLEVSRTSPTSSSRCDGRPACRAAGLPARGAAGSRRAQPCSACHICRSRSAVQMRGWAMPLASSKARETSNGRQCS